MKTNKKPKAKTSNNQKRSVVVKSHPRKFDPKKLPGRDDRGRFRRSRQQRLI